MEHPVCQPRHLHQQLPLVPLEPVRAPSGWEAAVAECWGPPGVDHGVDAPVDAESERQAARRSSLAKLLPA